MYVASVSLQDAKYPVENLLYNGEPKMWLCAKGTATLEATFQLEKECLVSALHVGNHGSSFIELAVGRSDWPQDQEFVGLMPTSSLMPPRDAKLWDRIETVQMYKKDSFVADVCNKKWDRLRVKCTQPFRRDKQFGLKFLRVHGIDEPVKAPTLVEETASGAEDLKRRYIQMTGSTLEEVVVSSPSTSRREDLYSRTERIIKATLTPKNKAGAADVGTPGSDQKPGTHFHSILESFLRDLDVMQIMADDVKVSDIREKLEKIICRLLTKPEKKLFRQRVPEYIQEYLDRSERRTKRRKAATKLEYTETTEPETPPRKERTRKSVGLDFDSDVEEFFEVAVSPKLEMPIVESEDFVMIESSPKRYSTGANVSKTPKRSLADLEEDNMKRKFTPGRSFLRKEHKQLPSNPNDMDHYSRQGPPKKPRTDFSSSNEILNCSGERNNAVIIGSPSSTSGRTKTVRSIHHLPPVVCVGESVARPLRARRVVPAVQGRRIKEATLPESIRYAHPSCMPVVVQEPARRPEANSNSSKSIACPLCNEAFPSDLIEQHAATCEALPDTSSTPPQNDVIICSNIDDDVGRNNDMTRDVFISGSVHNVICPLCGRAFSGREIEAHADRCADACGGSSTLILL